MAPPTWSYGQAGEGGEGYGFEELWETGKRGGSSVRGVAQLGQSGLDLQAQTVSITD